MSEPLYLAKSEDGYPALLPQMANRHGLITGATGTGKTVTLQSIAERLSYAGVPVFMADVKGDLSGLAATGVESPKLKQRLDALVDVGALHAPVFKPEGDVRGNTQVGKQRIGLKHDAEIALFGRQAGNVAPGLNDFGRNDRRGMGLHKV